MFGRTFGSAKEEYVIKRLSEFIKDYTDIMLPVEERLKAYTIKKWLIGEPVMITRVQADAIHAMLSLNDLFMQTTVCEFSPDIFIKINEVLCTSTHERSGLRMDPCHNSKGTYIKALTHENLESIYSERACLWLDNPAEQCAMSFINTDDWVPWNKYNNATVCLGITFVLLHKGYGYCDMNQQHLEHIMGHIKEHDVQRAFSYIMHHCIRDVDAETVKLFSEFINDLLGGLLQ